MPRYDFRTTRLYVDAPLTQGGEVTLDRDQANYLLNVLRLERGDSVLLFNGADGEWQANLAESGKRSVTLIVGTRQRAQTGAGDLHFLFAPVKHVRLDYLVQKAVEMGASRLQPVMTRHTQVARINLDRMRANAIEAAEQCGILRIPEVAEPLTFEPGTAELDRTLGFCSARKADSPRRSAWHCLSAQWWCGLPWGLAFCARTLLRSLRLPWSRLFSGTGRAQRE